MNPFEGSFESSSPLPYLLALVGIAVGAWLAITSFSTIADRIDELQRTPFPGQGIVALETGTRAVYYEPAAGTAAVSQPAESAFSNAVDILGPGGTPLPKSGPSASIQVGVGDLDGYEMLTVEVPSDGEYRVIADDRSGIPPGELAIGDRVFGETARTLIAAILGVVLALLSLAGLIAVAITRRSRRRRAAKDQLSSAGMEGLPPPPGEF